MANSKVDRFWRFSNPIVWALGVTALFFALIAWFGLAETCNADLFPKGDCPPKWRHLMVAPPNEVGDTLAGVAGGIAFIWLIATVLLQSFELGEQRRVLSLQREEMEEQRKATQDMARSMSAQAAIFEDEKRDRSEQRAHRELLRKLELVRNSVGTLAEEHYSAAWLMNLIPLNRDKDGRRFGHSSLDKRTLDAFDPNTEVDQAFFILAERGKERLRDLLKFIGPRKPAIDLPKEFDQCFLLIDQVIEMKPQLSDEDQIYLAVLRVEETRETWGAVLRALKGET